MDYQGTIAPVAKINIIVLLSLATNLDWPLLQFNVKNAFIYGDLKEKVYWISHRVPEYLPEKDVVYILQRPCMV